MEQQERNIYEFVIATLRNSIGKQLELTESADSSKVSQLTNLLTETLSFPPIMCFATAKPWAPLVNIEDSESKGNLNRVEAISAWFIFVTNLSGRWRVSAAAEFGNDELNSLVDAVKQTILKTKESVFVPQNVKERLDEKGVDDIFLLTMYLMTVAYHELATDLGRAYELAAAKSTN